jgi:hypothetical protein
MTREQIIGYVMALIDEVTAPGLDIPVSYIERHLDNASDFVVKNAPDQMIMPIAKAGGKHFPNNTEVNSRVIINEDYSGLYVLPTDFIRAISFEMAAWKRPVFEFLNNKDKKYFLQKNRKGRGNIYQPVCALVPFVSYIQAEVNSENPNTNFAIEFFSTNSLTDTVKQFIYIPKTLPENMPEKLIDPVAWFCAARALFVLRRYDESKEAERRGTIELTAFKLGETGDNTTE